MSPGEPRPGESVLALERPRSELFAYYLLLSFLAGPFFFVPLLPLVFRYRTLRYRFDAEGVSMGWGVLFRREIHLTYSRIQDIHLISNVVERWLGLARIQIQTASGSAKAEMTLEGLGAPEAVRDFLYAQMRGVRGRDVAPAGEVAADGAAATGGADELVETLRAVAAELRVLRRELADRAGAGPAADA